MEKSFLCWKKNYRKTKNWGHLIPRQDRNNKTDMPWIDELGWIFRRFLCLSSFETSRFHKALRTLWWWSSKSIEAFLSGVSLSLLVFLCQPVIYLEKKEVGVEEKKSKICNYIWSEKSHLHREKQLRRLESWGAHAAEDYQRFNGAENSFWQDFCIRSQCGITFAVSF